MPFKGYNKCRRCAREKRGEAWWGYPDAELKLEIHITRTGQTRLRVTCPKGHTYISASHKVRLTIDRLMKDRDKKKLAAILIPRIEKAQPDVDIQMEGFDNIKTVGFRLEGKRESRDAKFTWITEQMSYGHLLPMKNNTIVVFWKTLDGAKRNFIRRFLNPDYLCRSLQELAERHR